MMGVDECAIFTGQAIYPPELLQWFELQQQETAANNTTLQKPAPSTQRYKLPSGWKIKDLPLSLRPPPPKHGYDWSNTGAWWEIKLTCMTSALFLFSLLADLPLYTTTMSLRLTNKVKCLSSKFHSSAFARQNYFDTFKFVERLEKEGFSRQQSEAIMSSLQRVISESMMDLNKMMVSKAEREKVGSIYHHVALHYTHWHGI